ncbi:uncharacterized protein RCC_02522 [Ramularia collo-cygni]|uniref:DUF3074 domain-containing protein n=1 Tax=Ramularia collo-cygni TaxID=112498 RepID=A0A2D3UWR1_9PEZI|nr:uncharacterized protein RCC_02522 [Ramularia collo-cygni]CZT16687.1 uncharacterized protein RCC_02522 [Ramularia collo-cygni]
MSEPILPGRLVRMRALGPAELPSHPLLASQQSAEQTAPVPANNFAQEALNEAHQFVTSYWPEKFTIKSKTKQSSPSTALVELLSHEIPPKLLPPHTASEAWFARTSIHENAAKAGTASWEEFDAGLRQDHSIHETDYTPDCIHAHQVLTWDDQSGGEVVGWQDVHMNIMEMCHQLPAPLNKRVFSVLVITGKKGDGEFIVVQIPVDTKGMPGTKYRDDKAFTPGMYVSVERGALEDNGANVKWQMGTASDAGGVLPMFLQKLGVPGAVVKDVGLFIGWCEQRRQGKA